MKKPQKTPKTPAEGPPKPFIFSSSPQQQPHKRNDLYDKLRQDPKQFSILSPGFEMTSAEKFKQFRNVQMPKTPKIQVKKRQNRKLINSSSSSTSTVLISPKRNLRLDRLPKTPKLEDLNKFQDGGQTPKLLPSILHQSKSKSSSRKIIAQLPSILDSAKTPKLGIARRRDELVSVSEKGATGVSRLTNSLISISRTDSLKSRKSRGTEEVLIDPEAISAMGIAKTEEIVRPTRVRDRKSVDLFDSVVDADPLPPPKPSLILGRPGTISEDPFLVVDSLQEHSCNILASSVKESQGKDDQMPLTQRIDKSVEIGDIPNDPQSNHFTAQSDFLFDSALDNSIQAATIPQSIPPSQIESQLNGNVSCEYPMALFDSAKSPEHIVAHKESELGSITQSHGKFPFNPESGEVSVVKNDPNLTPKVRKVMYTDVILSSPILIPSQSQNVSGEDEVEHEDEKIDTQLENLAEEDAISAGVEMMGQSPLWGAENVDQEEVEEVLDSVSIDQEFQQSIRELPSLRSQILRSERLSSQMDRPEKIMSMPSSPVFDPQPKPIPDSTESVMDREEEEIALDRQFHQSLRNLPQSQVVRTERMVQISSGDQVSQVLDIPQSPSLPPVLEELEPEAQIEVDQEFQQSIRQLPKSQVLRERISSQIDAAPDSPDYDMFSTQVWRDVVIPSASPAVLIPPDFQISNTFTTALGKKVEVDMDLLTFGREIVQEASENGCQRSVNEKGGESVFRPVRLVEMKSGKRKRGNESIGSLSREHLGGDLKVSSATPTATDNESLKALPRTKSAKLEEFEKAIGDCIAEADPADPIGSQDSSWKSGQADQFGTNIKATEIEMLGGFTTGAGRELKAPSEQAIANYNNSAANFSRPAEDSISKFGGFTSGNGIALEKPSKESIAKYAGFSTAGGVQLGEPSKNAVAKFGGFTTGNGNPLDEPSKEAVAKFANFGGPKTENGKTQNESGLKRSNMTVHPKLMSGRFDRISTPLKTSSTNQIHTPFSSFGGGVTPFKTPLFKKPLGTPSSGLKNTPYKKPTLVMISKPKSTINSPTSISKAHKEFKFEEPLNRNSLKECPISAAYLCDDEFSKISIDHTVDYKFPQGGYEAIHSALIATGCNENCISLSWTRNHYKWILNKLICKRRRIEVVDITFDDVLQECLYRYQREVNDCKRSVIKKILEGDGNPSIHMVLFVSYLRKIGPRWEMKVSDGWYEVACQVDSCLTRLIEFRKIFVGVKLHIQGATISGGGGGVFDSKAILKFSGNNCRVGKWWARLGLCKPAIFPIRLNSIIHDGGIVGCVDFVVNRIFPTLYSEKVPGSSAIIRNSREDGEVAREWEIIHDRTLANAEKLYHDGEIQFETRDIQQELCDYTNERHPPRQVSVLFMCQIVDFTRGCKRILSIYAQNESEYEHWKEGTRIKMFGVSGTSSHIRSTFKTTHVIVPGRSEWYIPRKLFRVEDLAPEEIVDVVVVVVQTVELSSTPRVLKILATDESLHPVVMDYKIKVSIIPGNVLMCSNVMVKQGMDDGFRLLHENFSIISVNKANKPYLNSERIQDLQSFHKRGLSFPYALDGRGSLKKL